MKELKKRKDVIESNLRVFSRFEDQLNFRRPRETKDLMRLEKMTEKVGIVHALKSRPPSSPSPSVPSTAIGSSVSRAPKQDCGMGVRSRVPRRLRSPQRQPRASRTTLTTKRAPPPATHTRRNRSDQARHPRGI